MNTRTYLARPEREDMRALPPFEGLDLSRIVVLRDHASLERAARALAAATVVGLDTETKPQFAPGLPPTGPHLVQVATESLAILCPSHSAAGLDLMREVIASASVAKVGFGLASDRGPLLRLLGVELRAAIELSSAVQRLGYQQKVGLQAAVAIVLGRYLQKSKKVTTSNWAARELSERQCLYAANDAYASLRVHLALPPPSARAAGGSGRTPQPG